MHVMGPFLRQGGSAGLEDAIVLARCLYQKLSEVHQIQSRSQMMMHKVAEAMDQYVKEQRMRVVRLSMQTYLTGLLVGPSSMLVKLASIVFWAIHHQTSSPVDHSGEPLDKPFSGPSPSSVSPPPLPYLTVDDIAIGGFNPTFLSLISKEFVLSVAADGRRPSIVTDVVFALPPPPPTPHRRQ
ncbi:unnamed protein product [Camellia sinensis]